MLGHRRRPIGRRSIFRRRLLCEDPSTLAELAQEFGVSRERARQLEERLKGRIRGQLIDELGDALELGRSHRYTYTATSIRVGPVEGALSFRSASPS